MRRLQTAWLSSYWGAIISIGTFSILLVIASWWVGDGTGTAADWLAALSTMAAFGAAMVAGWYAARAYGIETKRDHDRDQERRAAQAEQVAAWFTAPGRLMFTNPSQLPIFNVHFTVHLPDGTWHEAEPAPLMSPTDKPRDILIVLDPPTLALVAGWFSSPPQVGPPGSVQWIKVSIGFRDMGGRHWYRDKDGALHRL